MTPDIVKCYRVGRSRRVLRMRLCHALRWSARDLWRWATLRRPPTWSSPFLALLRTWHGHQARCYCRTGTETVLRLGAFGLGLTVWLSRDITPRPCPCDKIGWLLAPSDHADEIEDAGGLDKLRTEFPGVGPLVRSA